MIYVVRGQQVMLDQDLALLYQVETGRLNEAVKRNLSRFPDRYRFQLTKAEYNNLKSQSAISSLRSISTHGGRRTLPYAFTEQGIAMLSSVLHSNIAIHEKLDQIFEYISEHQESAQKIFFEGQIYDAFSLISGLVRKARHGSPQKI